MVAVPIQSQPYTREAVCSHIERWWSQQLSWPQYVQSLRLALFPSESESTSAIPFVFLPGLCCHASGGDPAQAVGAAAAWVLLYTAAHILDDLADGETAGASGPVINVATGLIFTAIRALIVPPCSRGVERTQAALIDDFTATAFRMCAGQHADLCAATDSLELGWKIAEAKSGACFALACRAGARLAGAPDEVVECYSQFGNHLGVLLQICDDLHGLWAPAGARSDLAMGKRTLPVVYALSVLPAEERETLLKDLDGAPQGPAAETRARKIIEQSGAAVYLAVEARRRSTQALACLDAARPSMAPRAWLSTFLTALLPQHE
ncbi:MAG TPA: polyprenyl synthetase family protein [Anaerolineae bacterium]|nr:polyprenyl synthetase family protein [Anaerolineae bacterium]